MPEQDYAINYAPMFEALQLMDVQKVIDAVAEPWYNQTLIGVGDVLVRLGVMQGEFHWHKHDEQDEFFFVLDGCSRSSLRVGRPSSLARGRLSRFQPGCCTGRSCRSRPPC